MSVEVKGHVKPNLSASFVLGPAPMLIWAHLNWIELTKICKLSAGKTLWFEDITKQWLEVFDRSLSDLAVNTRGIHMRNIRAVFNAAIDNEITTAPYHFRRFKIKKQETIKRSIPAEDIRKLYEFECEPHQRIYVDMFILLFLFRGMNVKDLSHLKEEEIQGEQGCFVFLIYTVFSANYFNLDVHGFRVIWQRIIPSSSFMVKPKCFTGHIKGVNH